MKSRTLKCITAITLFAALAVPVRLANKVMAVMHFNVLDFILPPLMCRLGAEGPVQSNHCEVAKSGCGALSRRSLFSKRLVSSQIIAGRALNAPSDGAFAC